VRTHSHSAQDTEDFGWQLACARPAESSSLAVLYLHGELGSGKTTFARGFLRALGVTAAVRSPTYTLLELYSAAPLTLLHLDLYRLDGPHELESLGLREWAGPGHLWLVEWPEKGGTALPRADVALSFTAGTAGHDITARAGSDYGERWVRRLAGAKHGHAG
jgi:tRNA threonylcarbamoyladenosine biosynthesis protein TsaE